jgi:hypothetical protein
MHSQAPLSHLGHVSSQSSEANSFENIAEFELHWAPCVTAARLPARCMLGRVSRHLYNPLCSRFERIVTPCVQEIAAKYPKWLERNRGTLSAADVASYEAQIEHIQAVCRHLEEYGDSQFPELLACLQHVRPLATAVVDACHAIALEVDVSLPWGPMN